MFKIDTRDVLDGSQKLLIENLDNNTILKIDKFQNVYMFKELLKSFIKYFRKHEDTRIYKILIAWIIEEAYCEDDLIYHLQEMGVKKAP